MRVLRYFGSFVGVALLFVLSLVAGLLLHLNTSRARKVVSAQVNGILAPSFEGQIRIDRLGGLGLFGLSGTDVTIRDPSGRPVLIVRGARVDAATLAAARSALLGHHEPLTIRLPYVSVDQLDVRLDTDPKGQLDLLDAFASKSPSAATDPHARGLRLEIGEVALRHGWAHGQMGGAPPLDIDVDDFAGALTYAPDALEGDVAKATIAARRIANGSDVNGLLRAHVHSPSDAKAKLAARADWEGRVGTIAHTLHANLADDRVDVTVDAPSVDPAGLRALWAASAVDQPATLHAEAHGTLPNVDVALHAGVGSGALDANGALFVGDDKRAKIHFASRDLDVHEFAASAPKSRLAFRGDVNATSKANGALEGDLNLHFLGGAVGSNDLPPALVTGTASQPSANELHARVDVVIDEPAAPTRLNVVVSPVGAPAHRSSEVAFDLRSDAADLDRVPQLHHAVQGRAHVTAKGTLNLATMFLRADVDANADHIVQGSNRLDHATVSAHAVGGVASPRLDVTVQSEGVNAGGTHLDAANLHATGTATAPHVSASARGPQIPNADVTVDVDMSHGVSLQALRVGLARAGEHGVVSADRVRILGSNVVVENARIDGVGQPMTASLSMAPGTMRVRANSEGLDLGRVGRLAHLENNVKGGTLALAADLDLGRTNARGKVLVDVRQASFGTVGNVAAHLDAQLDGREITGKIHGQAGAIGTIDIDATNVHVAGTGPLASASWRQAWGWIGVDAHVDLARAAALVRPEDLPFTDVHGQVALQAHVSRDDLRDPTPDLAIILTTKDLAIAPKSSRSREIDGVLVMDPPPWRLAGIDFKIDGSADGDTGALELTAEAHDKKGELAQIHVTSSEVPYNDFLSHEERLATDLRRTPFDIRLVVPRRGLGGLPDVLKQNYVSGKLQAELGVTGTILAPTVDLAATLRGSRFSAEPGTLPLDLDVAAHYDGKSGTASVKGKSGTHETIDVDAQFDAAIAQFLNGVSSPTWKASAKAHFAGFPIDAISVLNDKLITGQMSGDVQVTGLHEDARADAALQIDNLKVGTFTYKSATIQAKADGRALDAKVRIDQTDGFAETNAHAIASWGGQIAPALDPAQPLDVQLQSKNFRIAVLLPFVEGTLDELDGRLDSDTRLELDPRTKGAKLSGQLALSRGTLEAAAGGGEFHDIEAKVRFAPDGTVTLDRLTASGLSGRMEASASARLAGTSLQSARGIIIIPSGSPIPLSAGGSEIGNIDGRFEIEEMTADDGKTMNIQVKVPHLRVALPEGSSTSAQALGPMERIHVGAHRGRPTAFVLVPLDPQPPAPDPNAAPAASTRIVVQTDLQDVQVVRGTQINIDLYGQVHVTAAAKTEVTGQINLRPGGKINVQGKDFEVESGTVTILDEDPSNPQIVLKAGYTAPDHTVVYANFIGPLKTGKVTLTSEPALPQPEVVQLLLFGTPDGTQNGQPQGNTETSAIGTVGGEAAQPLNHMLGQLGLGSVTANVDTTNASAPKPEVSVQIARDISLQFAVVLGNPPPGVNPDHTLVSLDWRFLSRWSLESTLGDAGTTIFDVLWQKRY